MKEHYDDVNEYIDDLKKEIATGDKKCANHYYNLGVAYLSLRDFAAAEEAFLNAIRSSSHLAEAYVQLGGICLERGDLDGCLHYNEEAAKVRPRFAIAQSNMAFVYLQKGEPDKAIAALRKALSWDPRFIQARHEMTTALFMKGDYEECERLCRELIAEQPGFAPAWNNLALALFQQGRQKEAVAAADKAIELGFDVAKGFLADLEAHR